MSDVNDYREPATGRKPAFCLFRDKKREWRFTLVGANGEPIATSESYTRKADARRGIEAVVEAARIAEVVG